MVRLDADWLGLAWLGAALSDVDVDVDVDVVVDVDVDIRADYDWLARSKIIPQISPIIDTYFLSPKRKRNPS